ncbi:hypothetical protein NQZ89_08515 [Streptococcus suis]|uniref:hypothetical protein n=1 Tax=Streptococcus sp. A18 TaxID=3373125 RepID=UPI00211BC541|nr:hypothetical protein NQZ89_08515 [Streptococcus suis]
MYKKIDLKVALYLLGYTFFVSSVFIGYTLFPTYLPVTSQISKIFYFLSIFLLVLKVLTDRIKFDATFVIPLFFFFVFLIIGFQSGELLKFFAYFLLIYGTKGIPIRKILKLHSIVFVFILLLTFLGEKLGIIPTMYHFARSGTVIRYYLGFRFPTFGANIVFHLICIWTLVRGRATTTVELVALFVLNYFYFIKTDTKSAYYFSLLVLVTVILIKLFKQENAQYKIQKYLEAYSIPVVSLLSIVATLAYSRLTSFLLQLNSILTSRLSLGYRAITMLGIKPFGQFIKWNTMDSLGRIEGEYFYVDASFLNLLLNYGYVLFILLAVAYFIIGFMNKNRTIFYTLSFVAIVFHSMWDPQFFEFWYNPLLLFIGLILHNRFSFDENQ